MFNNIEVLLEDSHILIEIDSEEPFGLLAYDPETNEQTIQNAWAICNLIGYSHVDDEYFDEDWGRYVCRLGKKEHD